MTRVLSAQDLQDFDVNGYVIVPQAVPPQGLRNAVDAIFDFLELNPDEPDSWYQRRNYGGTVYLHHHPALWANRQEPRVWGAFADLYKTEKLWVSMDRVGLKPPINARFPEFNDSGFIHWDLDVSKPLPQRLFLQGVLCLTDTDANMGGFRCVPGFHRELEAYLAHHQPVSNTLDVSTLPPNREVVPIEAKAGDLIIWNNLLVHGNGRNESNRPRLAQYITMWPASKNPERCRERVELFQDKRPPQDYAFAVPPEYQGREKRYGHAELSPLGRKLLGADAWE